MTAILVRPTAQGANVERRLSASFFGMDFSHQSVKAFGELRRSKTERSERKKARLEEAATKGGGVGGGRGFEELPDQVWARISSHLGAMERMRLGQCCRRLRQLTARWEDVKALEIKPDWAGDSPSCPSPPPMAGPSTAMPAPSGLLVGLPSLVRPKPKRQPRGFRVRLQFASGRCSRIWTTTAVGDPDSAEKQLKFLLARIGDLPELTLWESALSDRFRSALARCAPSLRCLRLWNCHRWLDDTQRSPQLLLSLLGLPSLRQLLFLDSTPAQPESACRWLFSKQMARAITAPLEELQLTNCRLPLRSLDILAQKCAGSLRRLAIGCTFGKDQKRVHYLRLLRQFRELADLDLPPFLFHLGDQAQPDLLAQRLFQALTRLRALGFRHFNSAALFRFIEFHLPKQIRVLRIHHNAHRVPNFAELGLGPPSPLPSAHFSSRSASLLLPGSPDSQCHQKKDSVASRSSILSSALSSDSLGGQPSPAASSHHHAHHPHHHHQPCRSATFCAAQPTLFSSSYSPCSSSSVCSSISWPAWPTGPRQSKRAKSFSLGPDDGLSMATSSTWCTLSTAEGGQNREEEGEGQGQGQQKRQLLDELARRKLTIFAIAEERQGGTGRRKGGRQQRLRKSTFAGVEVIYVSSAEGLTSQEVLGRMGAPIQSPYVYTTGQGSSGHQQGGGGGTGRGMRVIRGDLVRTIPLASLGMESDWESDEE